MQLKSAHQTAEHKVRDRITAAMETGNHGQARTLLAELHDINPALAEDVRLDVVGEYGISL